MKTKKLNQESGFSLVEIMIAAAALGALSLGVMHTVSNMQKGQVSSEAKMEELEVRRLIMTTLADKGACEKTFSGVNVGSELLDIKNQHDVKVFSKNGEYGNRAIRITNMITEDKGKGTGDGTRDVDLIISFQKIKKTNSPGVLEVRMPIRVKAAGPTSQVTACFSDAEQTVATATKESCVSIGGVWDDANNKCAIGFVMRAGDTMTGDLTTTGLTATGDVNGARLCTSGNCKTISQLALSNQACKNADEVARAINPDGTLNCKPLKCPSNQFFAGLDTAGNSVCRPYPTESCPTNAYVSSVDAQGKVTCSPIPNNAKSECPNGEVIQSINGGTTTCVAGASGLNASCASNELMTGISNGKPVCTPVITLYRCTETVRFKHCPQGTKDQNGLGCGNMTSSLNSYGYFDVDRTYLAPQNDTTSSQVNFEYATVKVTTTVPITVYPGRAIGARVLSISCSIAGRLVN